ncbi:7-deoxyloganetin glucosyltransferase [Bienertia sinuspersici]
MRSLDILKKANNKPHVVCVPGPVQGHISPMLNVAKLLHSKGFYITFVNTEFNHRRLLRSRGANSLDALPASFRFEAIPDGIPASNLDATQDVPSLLHAVLNNLLQPFKELLTKLDNNNNNNDNGPSSDSPPVTFILSDCVMPFTLDAATQLGGLPVILFWTANPNFLSNGLLDMVVDWVPSMKGIRLKDIPSFIRTMDKDDIYFYFMMICVEKSYKSSAPIIFNTFDALEHEVLDAIAKMAGPIYTIGPLHMHLNQVSNFENEVKSLESNLWKEDIECLEWLDLIVKPNSVIYVSFGSITTMTKDDLVEFAWGLAKSNHSFLWIVRPDIVTGDSPVLPKEFIETTKDRGMLANWCDQEKVLKHRATGAFLTHCGWNSSLEAICSGKPRALLAIFR